MLDAGLLKDIFSVCKRQRKYRGCFVVSASDLFLLANTRVTGKVTLGTSKVAQLYGFIKPQ